MAAVCRPRESLPLSCQSGSGFTDGKILGLRNTHAHTHMKLQTHTSTHTSTHASIHHTHMHTPHTEMHTHMKLQTHTYTGTHTGTYVYITHTHTRSHMHKYTLHMPPPIHAHTHKCTHAHTCKCTHSHMCTHMYTQRHAQEHTCTHSHVHAHTCTQRHIHEHMCTHVHAHCSAELPPNAAHSCVAPVLCRSFSNLCAPRFSRKTLGPKITGRSLASPPLPPPVPVSPERTPHTGGLPIADMDFSRSCGLDI